MIDFKNGTFVKLKLVNESAAKNVLPLLVSGETIVSCYKGMRDYVVFTNKRIISVNVQGITGAKKDFTSIPYSKIQLFSVETAGTFDLDAELDIWISGAGKIRFEFTGSSNIVEIGKLIGDYVF